MSKKLVHLEYHHVSPQFNLPVHPIRQPCPSLALSYKTSRSLSRFNNYGKKIFKKRKRKKENTVIILKKRLSNYECLPWHPPFPTPVNFSLEHLSPSDPFYFIISPLFFFCFFFCLPPPLHEMQAPSRQGFLFCSILYHNCLEQHLAHKRCSINIC